jgi:hypothetical protein
MLSRLVVLVLSCKALVLASRVRINNYCQKELFIIEATSPYGSSTPCVNLLPAFLATRITQRITLGSILKTDMAVSNQFNYSLSSNLDNATLVEIVILRSGTDSRDSYLIFTRFGFDFPLQLSSNTGPTFTCADPLVSVYDVIGCNSKF